MANLKSESVSMFKDGELHEAEAQRLLTEMYSSAELRKDWHRYHVIGDALRNNLPNRIQHDLATRITRALEDEPTIFCPSPVTPTVSPRHNSPSYSRGKITAIAASIAAIAVVTLLNTNSQVIAPNQAVVVTESVPSFAVSTVPPVVQQVSVAPVGALGKTPAVTGTPKLRSYVIDHEYSTASVVRRGLPTGVRVVTFAAER
ncbi:MAG: sigma-E factor negative regulatory protein RseA [Halothiobacillaceae bacterium]|nr:MAG: sigma-E factor negative regulatory protein RseA [Halothiobacillaceae bacterium]